MSQGQDMLTTGIRALPQPVEYLVAPGGYLTVLDPIVGRLPSGWASKPEALDQFRPIVTRVVRELASAVPKSLRDMARYFSLGIDVRDTDPHGWNHAELVAVVELSTGDLLLLTAKTYPTEDQTRTLIRAVDWETHLWRPGNGDRVLVLGCHDLNVYNNRALTNAAKDREGFKFRALSEGREVFLRFDPTHILHHPHATDIANTWRGAWAGVKALHPKLKQGVSGIGHPLLMSRENDDIEVVLAATEVPQCSSLDVIVVGNATSRGRQADVIPAGLDRKIRSSEMEEEERKELALYKKGVEEYLFFAKEGKKLHPRARTTMPAPPSKAHKRAKATTSNSCPSSTFRTSSGARASGRVSARSMALPVAIGAALGASAVHFAKRA